MQKQVLDEATSEASGLQSRTCWNHKGQRTIDLGLRLSRLQTEIVKRLALVPAREMQRRTNISKATFSVLGYSRSINAMGFENVIKIAEALDIRLEDYLAPNDRK